MNEDRRRREKGNKVEENKKIGISCFGDKFPVVVLLKHQQTLLLKCFLLLFSLFTQYYMAQLRAFIFEHHRDREIH